MKLKKIKLSFPNRLVSSLIFLIIGIALGVVATTVPLLANFTLPKIASLAGKISQYTPQQTIKVDPIAEKRQELGKFYNEIANAQGQQDWSKLYDLSPQSVKDNVTREEIVTFWTNDAKKSKVVSQEFIVHSVQVNGDNGIVDRTIITCLTKECTGNNRKEDNAKKEYVYINGRWQIPDPIPSERALKAVNYAYEDTIQSEQKNIREMFSYGSDKSSYALRNWAVSLDKNLEELVRIETLVEKRKSEASRPVYYQQPAQIIQQPAPIINQPAPVIQQQSYPRNCTSNTIGNYTYTNCY